VVASAQAVIEFLLYGSTLLFSGYYGYMSDIKGRMPVIRLSILGIALYLSTFVLTGKLYDYVGVSFLFIGPLFRGIFGGDQVLMAAIAGYISDCTPTEQRTTVFGHMMAFATLGVTGGSMMAGIIINQTGSLITLFYILTAVVTLAFCGSLFLPESNLGQHRKETDHILTLWEQINIFSAIKSLFHIKTRHASSYALPLVAGVSFLLTFVMMPPIILYGMLEFHWTAVESSYFISAAMFIRLLNMVFILPLVAKLLKNKSPLQVNMWILRLGASVETLGYIFIGLAASPLQFAEAGIMQSFGILSHPALRALLTMLADPADVGKVLGACAALEAFSMLTSQLGLNSLYGATVSIMPSLTFLVCAGACFLAVATTCFVSIREEQPRGNAEREL
jgi:MFS family permease